MRCLLGSLPFRLFTEDGAGVCGVSSPCCSRDVDDAASFVVSGDSPAAAEVRSIRLDFLREVTCS